MFRRCSRFLTAAITRDTEEFDVLIVGGGPSGLTASIKIKQLLGEEARVGLIEKGSEIGAHTLSGACFDAKSLTELLPEWQKDENVFPTTPVNKDLFYLLWNEKKGIRVPWVPPTLQNHGNYIISLGAMCKYLAEKAEAMGVEIYPGFAAADILLNDNKTAVEGIILNDMGVNKKGEQTEQFEPGMQFRARQTIFAEGCRGSCTKKLEKLFQLRDPKTNPQTYGLGIKEVWEVPKEKHQAGLVLHSVGWPLNDKGHENTYGGAFLYHYGEDLVSCGFVVGLDYNNPYIRPYMEMQKWKTHELMKPYFEGGKPLLYGARALVEGGYAALPKLTFPGGVLVGDCAGFLNLPKIKGNHTAMKSAILAAEAVAEDAFANGKEKKDFGTECGSYMDRFKSSWLHKELYQVRNVRQSFHKNFYFGMAYTGLTTAITKGLEPWTTPHQADHATLKSAKDSVEVPYPKPDNTLTFDLLTNHSRSGTTHNADQPVHLKLKNPSVAEEINYKKFAGPEGRYCPAGVYEFVEGKLVINAQNCLHCKTCDIKDPTQNIDWCVPEGGGGPNYQGQM